MIWRETVSKTADFLGAKGVEDPLVAAEELAARLLACKRGALAPRLDSEASERHLEAMRRAVKRLLAHEPLQYVLGEWDFRKLTLKCDRRALIPRPETEGLVSTVLDWLKKRGQDTPPFIVDVGTGTGAIILSLAAEFPGEAAFLGTDVSEDAISLAAENAAKTGLAGRVAFEVMDGLDDFDEPCVVDALVSNPPYIESAAIQSLDPKVRDYEPRLALDGGISGLDFYDRYLSDALNVLKPGGRVFFEIGETQGGAVAKLMESYGFSGIKVEKDLAGRDRYASASLEE